ncbi:hypothetical protein [Carboxylicivirga sp. N1Y90]|uniref:hypothetical protein n=1 Tax=Carboxylicivirga fragile TaxID=3417571 RepID=UPI003D3494FA|nr:hypothetical protein [Marinilabiliaceae bacterium N1Y90]
MNKTLTYNIGGIGIQVNFLCPFLFPDNKAGSHFFQDSFHSWILNICSTNDINIKDYRLTFAGSEEFDIEIPYKWSLYSSSIKKAIVFEFEQDDYFSKGIAEINIETKTIELSLVHHQQSEKKIDPFFHPFGILLLQYLVHLNSGVIIHASAVEYKNKGYLFSAISGTGKSTMANLWKSCGAKIINDDRIIISPQKSEYYLHNTPMPHYQDQNKKAPLYKAFLLKQAKENYIEPLSPIKSTMGLLSNCIQYQYDEGQVKQRLNTLENIAQNYGVFELGFKPDTSIVSFIENYFET